MRWSSAVSDAPALDEAVAAALLGLDGEAAAQADLAVAFVSHHHARRYRELPELLRKAMPRGFLLGCSAGGVIGGGEEIEHRPGFSLTVASLPDVRIHPFALDAAALPDGDASPRAWHSALAVPPEPLPHFILLADPFSFPAAELLAGLDYAYPASVKVGGLASGAREPGANALYLGGRIMRGGLAGVALAGDISVQTIVAQGCRAIGPPLRVTRCDGNLLLELDGASPLAALKSIITEMSPGDRDLAAHSLFLGVAAGGEPLQGEPGRSRDEYLIRNLIGIDPRRGALAVGELLREGQIVQFHLRDAAASAADLDKLLDRFAGGAAAAATRGALLFSCLGRGVHLYGRPGHDSETFRARLGDVPVGGFFCNGEIGPVAGATHLHGYTSAFGLFGPAGR